MNYFQRLLKGYIPLFIPLVLTMLRRSSDMDIAIASRGFGAPVARTYLEEVRPALNDYVAILLALVVFSGIFVYLLHFGGLNFSLVVQAK